MSKETNIHPEFHRQVSRSEKEKLLKQRGVVIWLYGLSGSGKSTLANALERSLHDSGRLVIMLDGDNLRSGLNRDLGFSEQDRRENIRRVAECAKTMIHSGVIVLVSLITPKEEFRQSAREIIGDDDLIEVYVKASFETCKKRDVKGLYAKVESGEIAQFTGKTSPFEEPQSIKFNAGEGGPDLILDTEVDDLSASHQKLLEMVVPRIML